MDERSGKTILVVDDEPSICWAFERLLGEAGHEVVTAASAEAGLELATQSAPDLVMLDVRLPQQDGITALPAFIQASRGAPVVIMTAFGDLETAVAAVQRGASDYLVKPFRLEDASRVVRNALRARPTPDTTVPSDSDAEKRVKIVGVSSAIQQAFRQIAMVAASDLSVLITGETGTGKELVAAAIHRHSHRSEGPYLPIAPVALNPDLIESELFGHVQGAFTGADRDRAGLFEQAEGGTVLLDEIGELPLGTQAKLLRVLEEGEYVRVGEVHSRRCDVRVLAATNANLHRAVESGTFRQDLFYRLNGLHIHLPPLRDRTEDIRPLCEYFLRRLGYPLTPQTLEDQLIDALARRQWAGNVRELRNAIEHAAVIARGRPLAIDDFPPALPLCADSIDDADAIAVAITQWAETILGQIDRDQEANLYDRAMSEIEPPLLRALLVYTNGNRAQAARILGIHRGTLRDKLKSYGLDEGR